MTVGQSNETEIRRIVGAAEQARMAGRREDAQRLLSQAQALAPDHPLVLNEAGIDQLRGGNAPAARRYLESAIEKDDKNPAFWLNLATAFRNLDLAAEEMRALERVLALEPRHLLGLVAERLAAGAQGVRQRRQRRSITTPC